MKTYPSEVTVIVYSVENLKPKKPDVKFCVIFSLGSEKFRTDRIPNEHGNPVFNTEASLPVEHSSFPLIFVVTEKKEKEFYGQLEISLDDLLNYRPGVTTSRQLQAHKKCPQPTGTIHYEAWISANLNTSEPFIAKKKSKGPLKGLKAKLSTIKHSPLVGRKNKLSISGVQGAYSCMDLSTNKYTSNTSLFDLQSEKSSFSGDNDSRIFIDGGRQSYRGTNPFEERGNNPFEENNHSDVVSTSSRTSQTQPEITGISPNTGLTKGGTKVLIRGRNLGKSREDIIGLYVCGSNVLGSLVYFNNTKIAIVTKEWKVGVGPITIETQSGGTSVSELKFEFKNVEDNEFSLDEVKRSDSLNGTNRSRSSTNLASQSSTPTKKTSKLANKLTLGLSSNLLSRSLMNLSEEGKKAQKKEDKIKIKVSDYDKDEDRSGPLKPPIVHVLPFMADKDNIRPNDTVKIGGHQLKELEQQLLAWQKRATVLSTQNKNLEEENGRLKTYIDTIVLHVMGKCPEVLCKENKL